MCPQTCSIRGLESVFAGLGLGLGLKGLGLGIGLATYGLGFGSSIWQVPLQVQTFVLHLITSVKRTDLVPFMTATCCGNHD